MNLKHELLSAVTALGESGIEYALCGGMAVVLHGFPRMTRDVDILIRDADLDRARASLAAAGFDVAGGMIPFDTGGPHERRVFRLSKIEGNDVLTIDLLLLPEFLEDVWRNRETYDVEGCQIQVVSRSGLIKMKRIAGRQQDLSDIENLEMADDR